MKRKIAVSLDENLVLSAEAAVRAGRSPSVSAYVSEAMSEKGRRDALAEVLAEMDREHGRPSREDERWARDVLGL